MYKEEILKGCYLVILYRITTTIFIIFENSMTTKIIIACDAKFGIGYKGTIPWGNNKEDLQWFKDVTMGNVVLMGKNTWEDPAMPKPLKGRTNVVVSKSVLTKGFDTQLYDYNIKPYVQTMKNNGINVCIIGGTTLIKDALDIVDEIWINKLPEEYNCDVYMPIDTIDNKFILQKEFISKGLHIIKYIKK